MKKVLFGTAVCACLMALSLSASAQLTSIDAIQYYNPTTGTPESPYIGQVVTVAGRAYVLKGTYNSGTHYLQGNDGGLQFFSSTAPTLAYGDSIQVTGTVKNYSGELELDPVTNVTKFASLPEPAPIVMSIADIKGDYENVGNFMQTTGWVVKTPTATQFELHDGLGDTLIVYVDADTHIDLSGIAAGDLLTVKSPCVKYNTIIEFKPRKQSDIITPYPVIENVNTTNWVPTSSQPIPITASIYDNDGTVASARLYYRNSAGDSTGAFSSVAMVKGTGTTWSASIPATHTMRQVDFYLEATDNAALSTLLPSSAPDAFYSCAIGFTPIYDVQYVHPDSTSTYSPLYDMVVNIQGVVTYGTGEVGAVSRFVVQDPKGGPFTGIFVYEGTGTYGTLLAGDGVQVGGRIDEYYALTEMNPYNGSAVYLKTFGNDLPPVMYASTRDLADNTIGDDGNGRMGEQYESCRVRTRASAVVDTLGAGNYLISDTGVRADSCIVDPFVTTLSYQPVIDDVVILTGWMDYAGGAYRFRSCRDEDVVSGLSGVGDDQLPAVQPAGGFVSIAPNPFNPMTKIEFALTRPNLVQLNVYNIRGELVKTLVNGRLEAGSYPVAWEGDNNAGQTLASGTYFARLRIGTEVMQVRKAMLLK